MFCLWSFSGELVIGYHFREEHRPTWENAVGREGAMLVCKSGVIEAKGLRVISLMTTVASILPLVSNVLFWCASTMIPKNGGSKIWVLSKLNCGPKVAAN